LLAWIHDNVSEEGTCLPADCCLSGLALQYKNPAQCWSSTQQALLFSSRQKVYHTMVV